MNAATFQRIARRAPFSDAGHGFDPFGVHPPALARIVSLAAPLYERYVACDSDVISRIPARGLAIRGSSHAGGRPIDAALDYRAADVFKGGARIGTVQGSRFGLCQLLADAEEHRVQVAFRMSVELCCGNQVHGVILLVGKPRPSRAFMPLQSAPPATNPHPKG